MDAEAAGRWIPLIWNDLSSITPLFSVPAQLVGAIHGSGRGSGRDG